MYVHCCMNILPTYCKYFGGMNMEINLSKNKVIMILCMLCIFPWKQDQGGPIATPTTALSWVTAWAKWYTCPVSPPGYVSSVCSATGAQSLAGAHLAAAQLAADLITLTHVPGRFSTVHCSAQSLAQNLCDSTSNFHRLVIFP